MDRFLTWCSPEEKEKTLERISGQQAIELPAAYFLKVPQSQNLNWMNLTAMSQDGLIVKTAPDFLIQKAIKTMERYGVKYALYEIHKDKV